MRGQRGKSKHFVGGAKDRLLSNMLTWPLVKFFSKGKELEFDNFPWWRVEWNLTIATRLPMVQKLASVCN